MKCLRKQARVQYPRDLFLPFSATNCGNGDASCVFSVVAFSPLLSIPTLFMHRMIIVIASYCTEYHF